MSTLGWLMCVFGKLALEGFDSSSAVVDASHLLPGHPCFDAVVIVDAIHEAFTRLWALIRLIQSVVTGTLHRTRNEPSWSVSDR